MFRKASKLRVQGDAADYRVPETVSTFRHCRYLVKDFHHRSGSAEELKVRNFLSFRAL